MPLMDSIKTPFLDGLAFFISQPSLFSFFNDMIFVTPSVIKHRADFFYQISSMLDAGLALPRILQTLGSGSASADLRTLALKLKSEIEEGSSFYEACDLWISWATSFEKALLQTGETSGTLDRTCKILADYLDRKASLYRQTISQLIYPLMIGHAALLVFPISLIQGLLKAGGVEAFLISKAITFGAIYGLALVGLWFYQKSSTEASIRIKSALFSWVPVLGASLKELSLARVAMSLHALLNSGASMTRSWKLASETGSNESIRKEVESWIPQIENGGSSPAELMDNSKVFPTIFVAHYQTGEASGKLDDSLKRIESYYTENGMMKLTHFCTWVPRLVYFIIAIVVAFQIVGTYSAMFQQTQQFLE